MKRLMTTAMALAILSACGGAGPGPGSTPQETFERMQALTKDKNYKAAYAFMDPDNTDLTIVGMTFGAGFACMNSAEGKKELEDLLQKHGFPKDAKPAFSSDKEENRKGAKELTKGVTDKPGLFAGLGAIMEKYAPDKGSIQNKILNATLKDVKIEGDRATGTVAQADGKTSSMKFVKRTSFWYMAVD